MIAQFLAGRNVEHWRRIHDQPVSPTPTPTPEDEQLRTYVAQHPCGGC
jgi:hypothetical protein